MSNHIIVSKALQDKKINGKERPWRNKKMKSLKVSESFKRLNLKNRAERTKYCGSELKFGECSKDGQKKLLHANFCKDRLCPMCNWRRSGMLQGQVMEILHQATEERKMKFIFLTLTVKNCKKHELKSTIDSLFEGFRRLFQYKAVDNVVVGWVRCLEITRNNKRYSKDYDTYHPHFHILIGVTPSYFSGQEYLSKKKWASLWRKSLKLDYEPIVYVKAVKPKQEGQSAEAAAIETAKYSVKDTDYIHESTKETDKVISVLAEALKSRRLVGFGKLFKEIKARLKLRDVESDDADLVGNEKKECSCPLCGGILVETLYRWHMGYKNYISVEVLPVEVIAPEGAIKEQ
jgi:plasmid rolling circle replication initiator protein Rep